MSIEKKRRNANMRKLHTSRGGPLSYREIRKKYRIKSVKTVYEIINRLSE